MHYPLSRVLPFLRLIGLVAGLAPLSVSAANYTWNAASGSWDDRSNWVETENWTPMAPEKGPSRVDRITAIDGSTNLSLGGVSRTVAEVYRRESRGKWYIHGDGNEPVLFSADKIENLCPGDLIFQNGGSGRGALTIRTREINITAGSVYFGAKSKTPSRAVGELEVREQVRISGRGNLYLNIEEGGGRASLGIVRIDEGGLTLNISPEAGAKRVGLGGLEGGAGYVQAGLDADFGGEVVLDIHADDLRRAALELRDSPATARGTARLSLSKRGEGIQVLTGKNTYGGTTSVEKGRLVVDGSHAGGDAYAIKSGGVLAGLGVIEAKKVVVESGGGIAPGNGQKAVATFTLALDEGLDLSPLDGRGGLEFDLGGDGASDRIKLSRGGLNVGTLTFSDFKFSSQTRPRSGRYVLIDATAPIVGMTGASDGEINGAPARLSIDTANHDVVLVVR